MLSGKVDGIQILGVSYSTGNVEIISFEHLGGEIYVAGINTYDEGMEIDDGKNVGHSVVGLGAT